jgi:hypothetical protein
MTLVRATWRTTPDHSANRLALLGDAAAREGEAAGDLQRLAGRLERHADAARLRNSTAMLTVIAKEVLVPPSAARPATRQSA